MSETERRRPIVIRRRAHRRHANHGTWKIAYADFMTALMAFFLVMWLLGSLDRAQLEHVGDYFRLPLKVALAGGDRDSASNSAIPGGGDDPAHSAGEVARTTPQAVNYNDRARLQRIQATLRAEIARDPKLSALASQLDIRIVPDGLLVQIFDSRRRPMFELGSARLAPDIADLLHRIAPTLSAVDNKLTLTGHTDDLAYASPASDYGNWELSADRANAARRALVAGGMAPQKLLRVIGAADTAHVAGGPANSPLNRRISILLLDDRAQQRIEKDNMGLERSTPGAPRAGPKTVAKTNAKDSAPSGRAGATNPPSG